MRKAGRLLGLIACMVVALAIAPATALAEDPYYYQQKTDTSAPATGTYVFMSNIDGYESFTYGASNSLTQDNTIMTVPLTVDNPTCMAFDLLICYNTAFRDFLEFTANGKNYISSTSDLLSSGKAYKVTKLDGVTDSSGNQGYTIQNNSNQYLCIKQVSNMIFTYDKNLADACSTTVSVKYYVEPTAPLIGVQSDSYVWYWDSSAGGFYSMFKSSTDAKGEYNAIGTYMTFKYKDNETDLLDCYAINYQVGTQQYGGVYAAVSSSSSFWVDTEEKYYLCGEYNSTAKESPANADISVYANGAHAKHAGFWGTGLSVQYVDDLNPYRDNSYDNSSSQLLYQDRKLSLYQLSESETPPVSYTVSYSTTDPAYTITPAEGSSTSVGSGGSFTFTVSLTNADAWVSGTSAVKANGTKLGTLSSLEGTYTISNITSNQTITVTGLKTALAGTVNIAGATNGKVGWGSTLTATPAITSPSDYGTLSYQWMLNGNDISGATSSTYTAVDPDLTNYLSCEVTASNAAGSIKSSGVLVTKKTDVAAPTGLTTTGVTNTGWANGTIQGTTTAMEYSTTENFASATDCTDTEVENLAVGTYYVRYKATTTCEASAACAVTVCDALTGTVTISGTAKFGETLTANLSADSNNTGTLSYQWIRNGTSINGATSRTYVPVEEDIGSVVACTISSSNQGGTVHGGTDTVAKASGPAAPTITAKTTSAVGVSDGKLVGTTAAMEYSTSQDFTTATDCTATETTGLAAGTYYVRLKATSTTEVGAATSGIAVNDGPYALTGTLSLSSTLTGGPRYGTAITASVTGSNNSGTLSYQWKRAGVAITGATTSTYTPVKADIGFTLNCVVTSSVETGSLSVTSATVAKASSPAAPTGISAKTTSAVGTSDGKLVGTTTAMEYSTSQDFATATNCTATETTGLAAGTYYARLKATDTAEAGVATSGIAVNDGPYALVGTTSMTPSGTAQVGVTLTASISGSNNTGTLSYQWTRTAESEGVITTVAILGATGATYTPTAADVGALLSYRVFSSVETGVLYGPATSTVIKASAPGAPTGITGIAPTVQGASDGALQGTTAAMEYSTSQDFATATDCTATETTGLAAGTYYVRLKATAGTEASASTTVTIEDGPIPTYDFIESITPDPITSIPNGTSLDGISLPQTVSIRISDERVIQATVVWDKTSATPVYNSSAAGAQTFTISGTIVLPEHITNTDNMSLATTVTVTVDAAAGTTTDAAADATAASNDQASTTTDVLPKSGDSFAPLAWVGGVLLALAGVGALLLALAARRRARESRK